MKRANPFGLVVCTRCGVPKVKEDFYPKDCPKGIHSWCKTCHKICIYERRLTPEGRGRHLAQMREYVARPDVAERRRQKERTEAYKATRRAYERSPRGKLITARSKARCRLRDLVNPDPVTVARLEKRLAMIEAELRRIDPANLELRAEPRGTGKRGPKPKDQWEAS